MALPLLCARQSSRWRQQGQRSGSPRHQEGRLCNKHGMRRLPLKLIGHRHQISAAATWLGLEGTAWQVSWAAQVRMQRKGAGFGGGAGQY